MGLLLPTLRDTAFAAVMREHGAHVRGVLRRRGIRGADLDDLTQNVFIVAFEQRAKLPNAPEKLGAWLGEVARRRALKWCGSSWNRRAVRVEPDELAELASESASKIEAAAILAEMVDRLPERYHEMMRMRAQGYTIDDIAKHYGIPWNTAHSRWESACEAMGARDG